LNLKSSQPLNKAIKRIQVLIIEDDRWVADALKLIMEDSGYEMFVATNAHQGLEQARLHPFDLTITDVQLPDMSGLDVLTILRKKDPDRPIIIITVHNTQEVIREAMARGAVHVLAKPFLPSEILDLARVAVAR
jgi:DNA-binding response OmpR family regulator